MSQNAMMRVDESGNGTTIEIRVGDSFEVYLPENPTAGFRWRLDESRTPNWVLLGDSFEPGRGAQGKPGAHCWTFRMNSVGAASIRMTYRRAWETENAGRIFTLTVLGTSS